MIVIEYALALCLALLMIYVLAHAVGGVFSLVGSIYEIYENKMQDLANKEVAANLYNNAGVTTEISPPVVVSNEHIDTLANPDNILQLSSVFQPIANAEVAANLDNNAGVTTEISPSVVVSNEHIDTLANTDNTLQSIYPSQYIAKKAVMTTLGNYFAAPIKTQTLTDNKKSNINPEPMTSRKENSHPNVLHDYERLMHDYSNKKELSLPCTKFTESDYTLVSPPSIEDLGIEISSLLVNINNQQRQLEKLDHKISTSDTYTIEWCIEYYNDGCLKNQLLQGIKMNSASRSYLKEIIAKLAEIKKIESNSSSHEEKESGVELISMKSGEYEARSPNNEEQKTELLIEYQIVPYHDDTEEPETANCPPHLYP